MKKFPFQNVNSGKVEKPDSSRESPSQISCPRRSLHIPPEAYQLTWRVVLLTYLLEWKFVSISNCLACRTVRRAGRLADLGLMLTFVWPPRSPSTGYLPPPRGTEPGVEVGTGTSIPQRALGRHCSKDRNTWSLHFPSCFRNREPQYPVENLITERARDLNICVVLFLLTLEPLVGLRMWSA